jgi:PEGA domain
MSLRSFIALTQLTWLVSASALPGAAWAQVTNWQSVVLYSAAAEGEPLASRAAERVEAALASRGRPLVSMHDARDRIRAYSREPVSPDTSDLDVLAQEARSALEHVAFGRSAAAKRSVQEVFRRAERALESLNRETNTARHVLDACLALVRSALARGDRSDALAEAMRCRRLVPDVAPSEFVHPPTVTGALAEADEQLRRLHIGRLTVSSMPESGCAVYINGRHLGTTPFSLERAAAGEYRVQVECSRAVGRVHRVVLGEQPVALTVDAQLDRALRDDPRVALVYDDDASERAHATRHALELGRAIDADSVLLVSARGEQVLLQALSVAHARTTGRAFVTRGAIDTPNHPALLQALDQLAQGRLVPDADVASTPPEPVVPAVVEAAQLAPVIEQPPVLRAPVDAHTLRTRRLRVAAAVLASTGVGLVVAGAVFDARYRDAGQQIEAIAKGDGAVASADVGALNHDYDTGKSLRWLALPGSLLATAAVPMARIDVRDGVPWWSYAVGAAGLGLASWGVLELARDGDCNISFGDGSCADRNESTGKGLVLLGAAAPLVAVPTTHLVSWRSGESKRGPVVAAHVTASGAQLGLRGEFYGW